MVDKKFPQRQQDAGAVEEAFPTCNGHFRGA